MSYQWECANLLALRVPCPTCHVETDQICRTISGAAAKASHAARRDPFMEAWAEGYLCGEADWQRNGGPIHDNNGERVWDGLIGPPVLR
jgi:hypothetical protein